MAEEVKADAGTGTEKAAGEAKPAAGVQDSERVTVNGVERTVTRAEILEGYSKHAAGQSLLDKFSQEKQRWTEEQRETLVAAKFGAAAKKALVDKDAGALRETLVGLGVGADDADQQVKAWEAKMAGETRKAAAGGGRGGEGQPNVEGVLRQMADAVIAIGKQNQEYAKRIELLEGTSGTLNRRDMARAEAEMMDDVERAIKADAVQGRLASGSPDFMRQLKADAAQALSRRLVAGERDVDKAIKESLQEARARLDNYRDGFDKADGVPISGLPSKGARGLERYAPKKPPEAVSMTSPGYGQYLLDTLAADEERLIEEAKRD